MTLTNTTRLPTFRRVQDLQDIAIDNALPLDLGGYGTTLRVRRGQVLPLSLGGEETVFVVRSATLLLCATLGYDLRQGLTILHPGDIFRSAFAPPAADSRLFAVSAGEVLRLRFETFEQLAADKPAFRSYFDNAIAKQTARHAVHMMAVGRFDSMQRLATFLTDLALLSGEPGPDGVIVFEMPLSRVDLADYLGLNADTLSRTISRLRATGLLIQPDRHTARVRDISALAALTPAAPALAAIHGETSIKI